MLYTSTTDPLFEYIDLHVHIYIMRYRCINTTIDKLANIGCVAARFDSVARKVSLQKLIVYSTNASDSYII